MQAIAFGYTPESFRESTKEEIEDRGAKANENTFDNKDGSQICAYYKQFNIKLYYCFEEDLNGTKNNLRYPLFKTHIQLGQENIIGDGSKEGQIASIHTSNIV